MSLGPPISVLRQAIAQTPAHFSPVAGSTPSQRGERSNTRTDSRRRPEQDEQEIRAADSVEIAASCSVMKKSKSIDWNCMCVVEVQLLYIAAGKFTFAKFTVFIITSPNRLYARRLIKH